MSFFIGLGFLTITLTAGADARSGSSESPVASAQITSSSGLKEINAWAKELKTLAARLRRESHNKVFEDYLKRSWDHQMRLSPEWATYVAYPGLNDQLSDDSLVTRRAAEGEAERDLEFLKQIKPAQLRAANQLNYDLLVERLDRARAWVRFPNELLALNQLGNPAQDLAELLEAMPRLSAKDYRDRLSRLRGLPNVLDANIETLREGLKQKVTPPKSVLSRVVPNLKNLTPEKIQDSAFFNSFKDLPQSIPEQDREAIVKEAEVLIREVIYPATRKYTYFIEKEYIPNTREDVALSSLPNGKEWYDLLILHYTTLPLTADEVHELGLKEVERLAGEMEKIKKQVEFRGSLADFLKHARDNKKYLFSSPDEMLATYRAVSKQIDAALPRFFGHLPRTPYGVEPVPTFRQKGAPLAYYQGGAMEAGRAGIFFLNLENAKAQQRWAVEDLVLHEAVPGHHLQIAISQELEGLPEFRKHGGYTVYNEGWGLYAETLGTELGVYKDPMSKFGQFSGEIWRACRLVVDTGIHAKGWSRDQAIAFMQKYLAKERGDIVTEVDRYAVWPGQALAYKIGQLKISELRKRAEEILGEKFSIRTFHDQVLASGALPLPVLEKRISKWIERSSATKVP